MTNESAYKRNKQRNGTEKENDFKLETLLENEASFGWEFNRNRLSIFWNNWLFFFLPFNSTISTFYVPFCVLCLYLLFFQFNDGDAVKFRRIYFSVDEN